MRLTKLNHIALIEEEKFFSQMVELTLKREGIKLHSWTQLQEALPYLLDIQPEILILDVQTLLNSFGPVEKGQEFIRQYSQGPQTKNIEVVLLGSKDDLRPFQEKGVTCKILLKPLSPTALLDFLIKN